MDQTSLNAIWKRIVEAESQIDGMIGRQGRTQDYLIDLADGRLWARSHEIDVWVEASKVRGEAAPLRMPSRVEPRRAFTQPRPVAAMGEQMFERAL